MEQLQIDALEWLLITAMKEKEECEAVISSMKSVFMNSLPELQHSAMYQERQAQLLNAEVCITALSIRILELKKAAA